jgi:hypothetical protein
MNKNIFLLLAFVMGLQSYAQITYRGCTTSGLGDQDYILVQTGTTNDGGIIRNTFESAPLDFLQSCPAGTCEIRIIWNIGLSRWEVQADNNGPITTPDYDLAVFYYNATASEPNPPGLTLGTWVDGTGGLCPSAEITVMAGDVQDTPLGIDDVALLNRQITMFPNPTDNELKIESLIHTLESVTIYTLLGEKVLSISSNFNQINISDLASNIYLVKIETTDGATLNKKLLVN